MALEPFLTSAAGEDDETFFARYGGRVGRMVRAHGKNPSAAESLARLIALKRAAAE